MTCNLPQIHGRRPCSVSCMSGRSISPDVKFTGVSPSRQLLSNTSLHTLSSPVSLLPHLRSGQSHTRPTTHAHNCDRHTRAQLRQCAARGNRSPQLRTVRGSGTDSRPQGKCPCVRRTAPRHATLVPHPAILRCPCGPAGRPLCPCACQRGAEEGRGAGSGVCAASSPSVSVYLLCDWLVTHKEWRKCA